MQRLRRSRCSQHYRALIAIGVLALAALACAAAAPAATPTRNTTPTPFKLATRFMPTLAPTYTRLPTYTPTSTPLPTRTPTITPIFTRTRTTTATPPPVTVIPPGYVPLESIFPRYATATPVPPCPEPLSRTDLRGKIIFWSDRNVVLTPTPEPVSGPFAPAYAAPRDALFVMEPDGSSPVPLALSAKCEKSMYDFFLNRMAVTADGSYRLTVEKSGSGASIFIRDGAGVLVRRLTQLDGLNYSPAWSPDQAFVAFVSEVDMNDEIYTITADGTKTRRLTFNTWEWDKSPSWSPDGKKIVFWSNRQTMRKQIWIMSASDGGQPANLSNNDFNDWDPIWINF